MSLRAALATDAAPRHTHTTAAGGSGKRCQPCGGGTATTNVNIDGQPGEVNICEEAPHVGGRSVADRLVVVSVL